MSVERLDQLRPAAAGTGERETLGGLAQWSPRLHELRGTLRSYLAHGRSLVVTAQKLDSLTTRLALEIAHAVDLASLQPPPIADQFLRAYDGRQAGLDRRQTLAITPVRGSEGDAWTRLRRSRAAIVCV